MKEEEAVIARFLILPLCMPRALEIKIPVERKKVNKDKFSSRFYENKEGILKRKRVIEMVWIRC